MTSLDGFARFHAGRPALVAHYARVLLWLISSLVAQGSFQKMAFSEIFTSKMSEGGIKLGI